MARSISTAVFSVINCFSLILGLAAVAFSLYFRLHSSATDCQRALQNPLLFVGLVLSVVSVLGLIGACSQHGPWVLVFYFSAVTLLALALIGFAIFVLVVTSKGTGKDLNHLGLHDYSNWLKNRFMYGKTWEDIRSCLADSKVCERIDSNAKISVFLKKNLSPIEAGCCNPPDNCASEQRNPSFLAVAPPTEDCELWRSDDALLCLDCESCKAGVLETIRRQWRFLVVLNSVAIGLVLLTFFIGCRAVNSTKDHYDQYYC